MELDKQVETAAELMAALAAAADRPVVVRPQGAKLPMPDDSVVLWYQHSGGLVTWASGEGKEILGTNEKASYEK